MIKLIDKKTGLTVPRVGKLFIDKISIAVGVLPHQQAEINHIFNNHLCGNYGAKKNGFCTSLYKKVIQIPFDLGRTSLAFMCDPWNEGNRYIRMEWNPAKVDLKELIVILDMILPDGFESLLHHGGINRIDTTIDMIHTQPHHLMFHYPKIQCSQNFLKGGKIQTAYLGDKGSFKQVVIYDKVAQLKKKNDHLASEMKYPVPEHSLTRVEMRLRPKLMTFSELLMLENPFAKLQMSVCKDVLKGDDLYYFFRKTCIYEGLTQAIRGFSTKDNRKKYLDMVIKSGIYQFWKPEKIWNGLPNALKYAGFNVDKLDVKPKESNNSIIHPFGASEHEFNDDSGLGCLFG